MYYFASDVHLGAGGKSESTRTERRFTAWLDEVSHDAKEIWLLGDIFDFWFEYRTVVPKGCVRTLCKLAELSERGIRIVWLTGNHDMWMHDYLTEECGIEVFTKPVFAEIAGRRMFVAHGDNMQIKGKPMLRLMNWGFRSRVIRFLFSWLVHPDLALMFGRWWSSQSRKSHKQDKSDELQEAANSKTDQKSILEPLKRYAGELGGTEGVECCIFGHFHIADDSMSGDTRVVFLGDWSKTPTYAKITDEGVITLLTFDEQ